MNIDKGASSYLRDCARCGVAFYAKRNGIYCIECKVWVFENHQRELTLKRKLKRQEDKNL